MTSFNSLPLPERQTKVNAILAAVAKRLPIRVRQNTPVMGKVVKTVWATLKRDCRVTKTSLVRFAREMDLNACQLTN